MKPILTLFFVFLFAFGKAQDSTETKNEIYNSAFKLDAGVWVQVSYACEGYVPYVMYNYKQHSVFVGWGITFNPSDYSVVRKPVYITGYRIHPNPKGRHFDLFFEYQFELSIYKSHVDYDCFSPIYSQYAREFDIKYRFYNNSFCWGFRFTFAKRFYLETSLGFGIGFEKDYRNYVRCDGTEYDYGKDKTYVFGYTGMGKAGIGFSFNKN